MMNLVERLQYQWSVLDPSDEFRKDVSDAIDRIEELEKQRNELLSILKYIAPRLADPVDSRLVEEVIASVGGDSA